MNDSDLKVSSSDLAPFILPQEDVRSLANKLAARYVPPKSAKPDDIITGDEFETVVVMAVYEGFMPLSSSFHFWKFDGKIQVMPHYAFLTNWAKKQCSFRTLDYDWSPQDMKRGGVPEDNFVSTCYIIFPSQERFVNERFRDTLQALLASGMDPSKAIELAQAASAKVGSGADALVPYKEVYYYNKERNGSLTYTEINPFLTPKGWIPGWSKVRKRALVNAIRRHIGEPSPAERYELSMMAQRHSMIAANASDSIIDAGQIDQYVKTVEQHNDANDGVSILLPPTSFRERRDILRGKGSYRDDITEPAPEDNGPIKKVGKELKFITDVLARFGLDEDSLSRVTTSMFGLTARYLNDSQRERVLRYFSLIKEAKAAESLEKIKVFYANTPELDNLDRVSSSIELQSQIKSVFDPSPKKEVS